MKKICHLWKIFAGKNSTFVLLIAWMAVIFVFSAKPAVESTQDSQFIGNMAAGAVEWIQGEDWTQQERQLFVENIDFYVRKSAHMAEYAVLGILLMNFICHLRGKRAGIWYYAWAWGVLYAVTDELHQYFVPGRACQLRDVVIDGAGVLIGVGLARWLPKIVNILLRRQK